LDRRSGPKELTEARSTQLAGQADELNGIARGFPLVTGAVGAGDDAVARVSRCRKTGEITLDVGHEHRDARRRQLLGQELQGSGLARAGGAGDQAVAVEHGQRDAHLRRRYREVVPQRRPHHDAGVGEAVAGRNGLREVAHVIPRSA
jgi:hypothetical protein